MSSIYPLSAFILSMVIASTWEYIVTGIVYLGSCAYKMVCGLKRILKGVF